VSFFGPAWAKTLQHEGGFVDHPADPGGATNFGISLRFLRETVDPNAGIADISGMTREKAGTLANRYFWHFDETANSHNSLELVDDQDVASKVFDLRFNMGPRTGVRLLQKALRSLGFNLVADGLFGPKTAAAANAACPGPLLEQIRREAVRRYLKISGVSHPFLRGWLSRAVT